MGARNAIQSLYDGEAYTLQLDSHHRFVAGWETALIDMLESLGANKPLLTSYAPHYNPRGKRLAKTVPWKIGFDQFTADGRLLTPRSFIENHRELAKPIPARFYSADPAFARGAFCREVPASMNFRAQTSSFWNAPRGGFGVLEPACCEEDRGRPRAAQVRHADKPSKWITSE